MNTYKRHRFPPEIISYAVWLYYRFNLSHRIEVENGGQGQNRTADTGEMIYRYIVYGPKDGIFSRDLNQ